MTLQTTKFWQLRNKADEQNAEKTDTKSADADNQTENTDNETAYQPPGER